MIRRTMASGQWITSDNLACPSVEDIAISMSRICRYGGHAPCSLLTHSLLVGYLARRRALGCGFSSYAALEIWAAGLLHDCHEVVTGDVLPWLKTPELREFCEALDALIFAEFHVESCRVDQRYVHVADLQARQVEVTAFGKREYAETFIERVTFDKLAEADRLPEEEVKRIVRVIRSRYVGRQEWHYLGIHAPVRNNTVAAFVEILEHLRRGDKDGAFELARRLTGLKD